MTWVRQHSLAEDLTAAGPVQAMCIRLVSATSTECLTSDISQ